MKVVLVCIFMLAVAFSAKAVNIDMVTIGNPGNLRDSRNTHISAGAVDHVYQIGKYEVTAGQYTEFLNAVAKADANGLYNTAMGDPAGSNGANIQRSGLSPNFTYSVAADWANRPVNYVSFWDAARFTNWLHNGQPIGPQTPETTEDGAYHDVGNSTLFGRNAGALFFIPTYDEWYKAAYHKNDGATGNYWVYPTASDTFPINTLPDTGKHANVYDIRGTGNHGYTVGSPYYRTEVAAFLNSASAYGTFDQGGNVVEWTETPYPDSSLRLVHGGSYATGIESDTLGSVSFAGAAPFVEWAYYGFRVASVVPEPSSFALAAIALFALPTRRRKSVPHNRV